MKKTLSTLFLLLCLLSGCAYLTNKIDRIVHDAIEKTGTEMMGVPVQVETVSISLTSGAGSIQGFTIGNPDGFTDPYAFSMDTILLNLNLKSITGSPIRLEEFILESPEVFIEVLDDDRVNLEDIAARLQKNSEESSTEEKPAAEQTEAEEEETGATLLAIDRLRIAGVKLTVRHRRLENGVRELTLPEIELRNVGGSAGITGAEISLEVVEAVAKEGLKQALRQEAEKQGSRLLQMGLDSLRKQEEAPKE